MSQNNKKDKKIKQKHKWAAAIPLICTIVYFLLAYTLNYYKVENAYVISLLVFLIIPFENVIVGLKKFTFEYPLFISIFYVAFCIIMETFGHSLWHPLWVLFLTIPIYFIFRGKEDDDDDVVIDFDADK